MPGHISASVVIAASRSYHHEWLMPAMDARNLFTVLQGDDEPTVGVVNRQSRNVDIVSTHNLSPQVAPGRAGLVNRR
jgi:hypothetical protein